MHILHLSDLHFSSDDSTQKNILSGPLLKDLEQLVDLGLQPDLVLFTGDLVYNPDEKDAYCGFLGALNDILATLSLDERNCVLIPGNHDVSRSTQRALTSLHASAASAATSMSGTEAMYGRGDAQDYLLKINAGFFSLADLLGQTWQDPFFHVIDFPKLNLSAVALNTTFACSLTGSAADHGKLIIPTSALEKATSKIAPGRNVITLGHHPISHWSEQSTREAIPIIQSIGSAHFFGHLHSPQPVLNVAPTGSTMFMQSGALYSRQNAFKGYGIFSLGEDGQAKRAIYRTYFDNRREFAVGENVADQGTFFPNTESKVYWESASHSFSSSDFMKWLKSECLSELVEQFGERTIYPELADEGRSLSEVYVFPPIAEDTFTGGDKDDGLQASGHLLDCRHLLGRSENLIIAFPPEYGATSFLHFMALQFARHPEWSDKARIPLVVDVRHVKPYQQSATRALKQAHPDIDHKQFGWKNLAERQQPYVILVDNLQPESLSHLETLERLHAELPGAKFIVIAKVQPTAEGLSLPQVAWPFSCEQLALRPFNRSRVRELVRSHRVPQHLSEDALVEEIMQKFWSLGIPKTAPLLSMYILIRRQLTRFSPLNISSIVEKFVEDFLLSSEQRESTFEIDEMLRGRFDKKEQIGVLGHLAEKFSKGNAEYVGYDELIGWIEEYYGYIGIERSAALVAHHFSSKGVLERHQNTIGFRYRIVQSFFAARRMITNVAFKGYIFNPQNVASFVQEIDIYTGLSRSDEQGLHALASALKTVESELVQAFAEFSTLSFESMKFPVVDDLPLFQEKLGKILIEEESRESADSTIEPPVAMDAFRRRMNSSDLRPLVLRWLGTLRALSVAVRNSEEVSSADKIVHLRTCLDNWGALLKSAVFVVGICFEGKTVKIGDMKIQISMTKEIDSATLRLLLANIPRAVALQASVDLATQKLDTQFQRLEGEGTAETELVRIYMMAALRLPGYRKAVDAFVEKHKKSSFLLESLMWGLRDVYLRYGGDDGDADSLRRSIASVSATAKGLKGPDRDKYISEALQRYKKQRLIHDAKQ